MGISSQNSQEKFDTQNSISDFSNPAELPKTSLSQKSKYKIATQRGLFKEYIFKNLEIGESTE